MLIKTDLQPISTRPHKKNPTKDSIVSLPSFFKGKVLKIEAP